MEVVLYQSIGLREPDLFVDPAARGKGYGRQLIIAVAEEAKKLGVSLAHLEAIHMNQFVDGSQRYTSIDPERITNVV